MSNCELKLPLFRDLFNATVCVNLLFNCLECLHRRIATRVDRFNDGCMEINGKTQGKNYVMFGKRTEARAKKKNPTKIGTPGTE